MVVAWTKVVTLAVQAEQSQSNMYQTNIQVQKDITNNDLYIYIYIYIYMCIYIYFILEIVVMATTTAIYIKCNMQMYTHVSKAFIVSTIAYDPRNKFHYCMSKFLQVRS